MIVAWNVCLPTRQIHYYDICLHAEDYPSCMIIRGAKHFHFMEPTVSCLPCESTFELSLMELCLAANDRYERRNTAAETPHGLRDACRQP